MPSWNHTTSPHISRLAWISAGVRHKNTLRVEVRTDVELSVAATGGTVQAPLYGSATTMKERPMELRARGSATLVIIILLGGIVFSAANVLILLMTVKGKIEVPPLVE